MNEDAIYTGEHRGDLKKLNLPLLKERATLVLSRFDGVAGAYLFGSALDFVRPQSDIDVGIIVRTLDGGSGLDEISPEIEAEFHSFGGHPFHITVLDGNALNLTFHIIAKGHLFYIRDYDFVTDFIERVARQHEDVAPFLQTYRATRLGRLFA